MEAELLVAPAPQRDAELRELVEVLLAGAPVVAGAPVLAHLLDVGEGDALRPVVDRFPLGPARTSQPVVEVGEIGVTDGDLEGSDGGSHGVTVVPQSGPSYQ